MLPPICIAWYVANRSNVQSPSTRLVKTIRSALQWHPGGQGCNAPSWRRSVVIQTWTPEVKRKSKATVAMHSMHSCCKEDASKNTMAERVAERNTQESNPKVDSHCAMAIERLTQVLHRTKMNQADQALCAPQFPFFSERLLRMLEPSAHNGKPPGTKRNTAHLGKGNQQPCQHALETNNPMQGFSAVCGCVVHCGPIHPLRTLEACVQSPSIFLKKIVCRWQENKSNTFNSGQFRMSYPVIIRMHQGWFASSNLDSRKFCGLKDLNFTRPILALAYPGRSVESGHSLRPPHNPCNASSQHAAVAKDPRQHQTEQTSCSDREWKFISYSSYVSIVMCHMQRTEWRAEWSRRKPKLCLGNQATTHWC